MEFVVGIALVIVVLIIIGLLLRRRLYVSVDRLESWKVDIINRNVAEELSRMKELNLIGETLESFNKWTERWEAIVTEDLQDVEALLLQSEGFADRYKFSSAKESLAETEAKLTKLEEDLNAILTQLDELLTAEESSRKRVEEIKPIIEVMNEELTNNEELYGRGLLKFKSEFDKINNELVTYDKFVENGEYYQAKEIVNLVNDKIESVQKELEEYPDIYEKCKYKLPKELEELKEGIEEMKSEGYPVESLGYEKEIKNHQLELLICVKTIEEKELESSKETIPKIEESIQNMYDSLEAEVEGRKYIETELPLFKENLRELEEAFAHTHNEVLTLKEAYYFAQEDLNKIHTLDKEIEELKTKEVEVTKHLEEKTKGLSELKVELADGFVKLEQLNNDHQIFDEHIHMLRKDEIEAREKLDLLKNRLDDMSKKLKMNNLPGVPDFIWKKIDVANNERKKVVSKLSESPLDMKAIQSTLSNAEESIHSAEEQVDLIIEQAHLTERVIQYANRYRSSHPEVAESLIESEQLFRSYEYELALETAASAVELVEPGALKNIEAQ